MKHLNELPLWDVAKLLHDRQIQARDLLESCFKRINKRESEVEAFTCLDQEFAFNQVKALETRQYDNPLFGIPVGVKDIVNTVDFPTTMGSSIYANFQPDRDAGIVAQLKNAGTIIPGKTESTEFAFFAPGKSHNPHALEHTPGGSSMGSAAAVADHMLPFSIGTQTAGSVIRPATYCGIVGYKASHDAFTMEGICGLAQSLDSLGFFVRDPRDLFLLRHSLLGCAIPNDLSMKPKKIGVARTAYWSLAENYQQDFLWKLIDQLENESCEISEVEIEPHDELMTDAQATIMAFEASRSLAAEFANHRDQLSPQVQKLIQDGIETSFIEYQDAKNLARLGQASLRRLFEYYDLLISLSATGEAPRGLQKTGDPIFNRLWTLLKLPCISLPLGVGPNDLPIGIQLIGAYDLDEKLIQNAIWISENP